MKPHPIALIAIFAAEMRHYWGSEVSRAYVQASGCPFSLYRLACQLKAANKMEG